MSVLRCHPTTPCPAVRELHVDVAPQGDRALVLDYRLVAGLGGLRVPAAGAGMDPERLWEHTCFELFVAPAESDAYIEWNFSPSGQTARFEFSGYRERRSGAASAAAPLRFERDPQQLRLTTTVEVPAAFGSHLVVGLTAVIEDAHGECSYWALHHATDRPDFHQRDGFARSLALPNAPTP